MGHNPLMIQELDGVVLRTSKLDAMVDFYVKTLGLQLVKKGKAGAFLALKGQSLVLEAEDAGAEPETGGFRSFLTFKVADADAAFKALQQKGVKFSGGPKPDELGIGAKVFSTMDPDGNLVGFVQR